MFHFNKKNLEKKFQFIIKIINNFLGNNNARIQNFLLQKVN